MNCIRVLLLLGFFALVGSGGFIQPARVTAAGTVQTGCGPLRVSVPSAITSVIPVECNYRTEYEMIGNAGEQLSVEVEVDAYLGSCFSSNPISLAIYNPDGSILIEKRVQRSEDGLQLTPFLPRTGLYRVSLFTTCRLHTISFKALSSEQVYPCRLERTLNGATGLQGEFGFDSCRLADGRSVDGSKVIVPANESYEILIEGQTFEPTFYLTQFQHVLQKSAPVGVNQARLLLEPSSSYREFVLALVAPANTVGTFRIQLNRIPQLLRECEMVKPVTIPAQIVGDLAPPDCHLQASRWVDSYSFSAFAGQILEVQGQAKGFTPLVRLIDSAGTTILWNQELPTQGKWSVEVPGTGQYSVRVTSMEINRTGPYQLELGLSSPVDGPNPTACSQTAPIPIPGFVYGTLEDNGCRIRDGGLAQGFTFAGQAGQTIGFVLRDVTFSEPKLFLIRPDGIVMSPREPGLIVTPFRVEANLPQTGLYRVVVSCTDSIQQGFFTLTAFTGPRLVFSCREPVRLSLPVQYEGILTPDDCRLEDGSEADVYWFEGKAGQQVALTYNAFGRSGGLTVLGSDGRLLGSLFPGNKAIPLTVTLPENGSYLVVVETPFSRFEVSYTLGIKQPDLPGGGCGEVVPLQVPTEVTGSLAAAVCPAGNSFRSQDYAFSGEAGQRYYLRLLAGTFASATFLLFDEKEPLIILGSVAAENGFPGEFSFVCPARTRYGIRVLVGPARSTPAGAPADFKLLVRAVPVDLTTFEPCAPPASITIPAVIQPDFRETGCQFDDGFAVHRYRFEAAAGRFLGLFLQEYERPFSAYLLAPDGSVLGEYHTRNITQNLAEQQILIGATIPVTGSYTLILIGLDRSIRGGMKLVLTSQPTPTVACDPPPFLALPAFVTGTMEPGDCLLSNGIRAREYRFRSLIGTEVVFTGSSQEQLRLTILRPDGSVLAQSESYGLGQVVSIPIIISQPGPYVIRMANPLVYFNDQPQPFQLTAQIRKSLAACPAVEVSAPVVLETTLTSTDCPQVDGSYATVYEVTGPPDSLVTVRMTSPDFKTILYLLDAADQVVDSQTEKGTGFKAELEIRLTSSGKARVVAGSYHPQRAGRYQLSIN
ncbi:MAG: hypothetical protein K1Y36_26165 [Blastocatellia bacterium]|nr:hypothetical protein [Blastocatellia bacterium]